MGAATGCGEGSGGSCGTGGTVACTRLTAAEVPAALLEIKADGSDGRGDGRKGGRNALLEKVLLPAGAGATAMGTKADAAATAGGIAKA